MHSQTTSASKAATPSLALVALLAALFATTPLAIDMYLPAMPTMAEGMGAPIGMVQQSLSIFLVFYALGMLITGPLADSLGRRKLALSGLAGFALASVMLSQTNSIEVFLFWRAIQAFSGAAATVVVPGIIRYLYQEHTAKGMSYVAMTMMLAPLLAPALGSLVMWFSSWQMIFVSLALYAAIMLLICWRYLPNINQSKPAEPAARLQFLHGYKTVLSLKAARPDIATSMFSSFAFFCFLTAVPLVYIEYFGVNELWFALLFAFNVLLLMLANLLNSRLVSRTGPERMLKLGVILALSSASLLVLFNALHLSLWFTVLTIGPLMASLGLIATNADAMILMRFPEHTGTATAVIGTLRFGSGALAGPLLALTYTGTALPFSVLMWLGVLCILLSQWHKQKAFR